MAQTSFPFENADTTETQYSWLFRNFSAAPGGGVVGGPGDINLKVTPGTGLTSSVASGQAMVRGHYYSNTAAVTLTHDASTSNPRIDSVVLTLDPTANSIVLAIVKGTASATPVAPSLTQTDSAVYQIKLADVTIQGSAISIASGDISDQRAFFKNVWTSTTRPAGTLGLFGWNTTLGTIEGYNGSAWVSVNPTSLDASVITSGTLPITRGGTGAGDAASARTALGITPGNIGAQVAGSYAASSHTHAGSDITSAVANATYASTAGSASSATTATNATNANYANGAGSAAQLISGGIYIHNDTNAWYANTSVAITSGHISVADGVYCAATYNQTNSGRALYVASDGLFGVGSSSERFKENIQDAGLNVDALRSIAVRTFNYKKDFGDDQSTQIGVIAEELVALGLSEFVFFDADGVADGVAYDKLALAAISLAQAQAVRLDAIEARLAKLEK